MTAVLILAAIVAIDQLTKYIAVTKLMPVGSVTFIKGIMDFTFVRNFGAAFGILQGAKGFFVLITLALAVGSAIAFKKMPKTKGYGLVRASLLLILGGAIGNCIDRLFRGYVVDFFDTAFMEWPVFNMADIFVVIGAVLMAFTVLFVIKDEPKKAKGEK